MRVLLLLVGISLTISLPALLTVLNLPFISWTYGRGYAPFELFGFFGSLFVLGMSWRFMRSRSSRYGGLFGLLFMTVMLVHLGVISEYSLKSNDYRCYEEAAQHYLAGASAYDGCYFSPPPVFQSLAFAFRVFSAVGSQFGSAMSWTGLGETEAYWRLVFYVYQCLQFFLVMALFLLLYEFSLRLRLSPRASVMLVSVLLVLNNPLLRAIRFNQINLWVLDLMLLAIVLLPRHAFAGGVALAAATALKLYPVTLFLPLLLRRNWKALTGGIVGVGFAFLLSTKGGRDWAIWPEFFRWVVDIRAPWFPFRDNSVSGFVAKSLGFLGGGLHLPVSRIGGVAFFLSVICFLTWFAFRFKRREGMVAGGVGDAQAEIRNVVEHGHLVDMCALGLLVSPLVWEHHYVMALPVMVWALCTSGARQRLAIVGSLLILAIPTFDFYPFSYHRLVGLGLLLLATNRPGVPFDVRFWEAIPGLGQTEPRATVSEHE